LPFFGKGFGSDEQPSFGTTVSLDRPPPPISGGTMIALSDGAIAVAADSDRDQIAVVDLVAARLRGTIALAQGDEPGRLVEDAAGRVHVALRGGQALVTVEPHGVSVLAQRPVCAAPRGVAYDPASDLVHVACAGGELVSLPAAGGPPVRSIFLERDLRDVVVDGDRLLVSTFKRAELLVVDASGSIENRLRPDPFINPSQSPFAPGVAWRTIAMPGGGGALMVHQRALAAPIQSGPGAYYGSSGFDPCTRGAIHASVTRLARGGAQLVPSPPIPGAVLPVDVAIAPDGSRFAVAAAGNSKLFAPTVFVVSSDQFVGKASCVTDGGGTSVSGVAQAVAVAFTPSGDLLVQLREPAGLVLPSGFVIKLSDVSVADTGHDIFHSNSGAGLACASCHPEGGEDGRVWQFADAGPRRSQSLLEGVLGTEPFHWGGEEVDFPTLTHDAFVGRMAGPKLTSDQQAALTSWVTPSRLLADSPSADPASAERGAQLFNQPLGGCSDCHNGPKLTNNKTLDVGTGGSFQVPPLCGVAWRAPFFHDGRVDNLRDALARGPGHGNAGQLTDGQIDDLVAYMETL
jgi:hypothetical protein